MDLRSIADSSTSSTKPKSLSNEQTFSQLSNKETAGASMPEEMQPSTSAEVFAGDGETENNMNAVISNVNSSESESRNRFFYAYYESN